MWVLKASDVPSKSLQSLAIDFEEFRESWVFFKILRPADAFWRSDFGLLSIDTLRLFYFTLLHRLSNSPATTWTPPLAFSLDYHSYYTAWRWDISSCSASNKTLLLFTISSPLATIWKWDFSTLPVYWQIFLVNCIVEIANRTFCHSLPCLFS